MTEHYEKLRALMVEDQLKKQGIKSEAVLTAMLNVERHHFVPENLLKYAYNDSPLPIGLGQTISQPYIVAYMTEQLLPIMGKKILEIGTGSGYQAAILAYMGAEVYTIELLEELSARAQKTFKMFDLSNIKTKCSDGFSGWPEEAPFDVIIVTAAPERIPANLITQLKDGGKMLVPVGPAASVQFLKCIVKTNNRIIENDLLPVRFVPMVEN